MDNIIAAFRIADDVDDPKIKGVSTGYAPHHKFAGVDYLASGTHTYPDKSLHYPGETLCARISFPSWKYFKDAIKAGDSFEVRELDRLIGYGTVEKIL
ncbi:hypothetical protein SB379_25320 [Burkholderia multivorans]|uniref:hypothetical protein n=1 Tax=Burkholderia multivorans TaxID=87883 RepID=UPI000D3C952C|nr:hypothetical protein [Burkholderia multivorans]MBR8022177.1 hypothetical protein [Burkholderia multivorans]MEB2511627.1 hypothetical protein [Burkholderia multivorans]MEB2524803.1 hypothetical protein [Burkholderia multivorans]MEB2573941.1 hypothetical protein [Burkholderia multivorans]MEB2594785.1 hypothetical protein [Burkholderia multivorans]